MTTRQDVIDYVKSKYNVEPEYLRKKYPTYAIFRNPETRKWFGVVMLVNKEKVNAGKDGMIDILDVKSDPGMIEYLRSQGGYRPAYHMNKENWITLLLGALSTKQEMIFSLIDISYKYSCKDWKKQLGLK